MLSFFLSFFFLAEPEKSADEDLVHAVRHCSQCMYHGMYILYQNGLV